MTDQAQEQTDKRRKKGSKRGKWSRDRWIRILELLAEMSDEERERCIRATAQFYGILS